MARKYTSMDINCFSLSTGKIFGRLITDLGTDSQGVTWESKLRQNMDTEVLDFGRKQNCPLRRRAGKPDGYSQRSGVCV